MVTVKPLEKLILYPSSGHIRDGWNVFLGNEVKYQSWSWSFTASCLISFRTNTGPNDVNDSSSLQHHVLILGLGKETLDVSAHPNPTSVVYKCQVFKDRLKLYKSQNHYWMNCKIWEHNILQQVHMCQVNEGEVFFFCLGLSRWLITHWIDC